MTWRCKARMRGFASSTGARRASWPPRHKRGLSLATAPTTPLPPGGAATRSSRRVRLAIAVGEKAKGAQKIAVVIVAFASERQHPIRRRRQQQRVRDLGAALELEQDPR